MPFRIFRTRFCETTRIFNHPYQLHADSHFPMHYHSKQYHACAILFNIILIFTIIWGTISSHQSVMSHIKRGDIYIFSNTSPLYSPSISPHPWEKNSRFRKLFLYSLFLPSTPCISQQVFPIFPFTLVSMLTSWQTYLFNKTARSYLRYGMPSFEYITSKRAHHMGQEKRLHVGLKS